MTFGLKEGLFGIPGTGWVDDAIEGGGQVTEVIITTVVEGGETTYNQTSGVLTFVVEGTGATLSGDFDFWKRKYEDMKTEWNNVNEELKKIKNHYHKCVNYYNYIKDYSTTASEGGCANFPVDFLNYTNSNSSGTAPSGLVKTTYSSEALSVKETLNKVLENFNNQIKNTGCTIM
jgi:hypothetical protein